jgi:hypothetical protein
VNIYEYYYVVLHGVGVGDREGLETGRRNRSGSAVLVHPMRIVEVIQEDGCEDIISPACTLSQDNFQVRPGRDFFLLHENLNDLVNVFLEAGVPAVLVEGLVNLILLG